MKLHYSKILLFSLLLIILVISSSNEHNKTKPYITPHTATTTSRVLIECNIYMPNYDNDPNMNSVKENFHKQTEQRFHEYDKRMIKNRQKRKEKCDKDIQKIIVKDKMEKSLVEKVEKGCLKCGYGLGGVATSVGVFGTAVVNELKRAAMATAIDAAIADGASAGKAAGDIVGAAKVVELIKSQLKVYKIANNPLRSIINVTNYTNEKLISGSIHSEFHATCISPGFDTSNSMCSIVETLDLVQGSVPVQEGSREAVIKITVTNILSDATKAAATENTKITTTQTAALKAKNMAAVHAEYNGYISSINASIIAILIIVFVMVIIYLILRFRRKKKMNKKLQYTKLLSQ
ncbi:PIR protein, putative [Plasmodium sp. gorilla clade G1]|nr:PIR protein, putative [Plasmodium sp. gorilla clade G1]